MVCTVHCSSSYQMVRPYRRGFLLPGPGVLNLICLLPLLMLLSLVLLLPLLALPLMAFRRESSAAFLQAFIMIITSAPGSIIFRRWLAVTMSTTSSTFPPCRVLSTNLRSLAILQFYTFKRLTAIGIGSSYTTRLRFPSSMIMSRMLPFRLINQNVFSKVLLLAT